jgi:glutathione S-transferase
MVPVIREVRQSPAHTDPASIAAGIHSWNRHMTLLDGQLRQTGAFATGARFTLADIVLGLSTHRWFMTPMERPALPAVAAYYERLSQRPAFMAHGRNGVP